MAEESDPKNDKEFWRAYLPHANIETIRAVAGKVHLPIHANNIDDQGIVHIHIPTTLRAPNDMVTNKWFAHIYDRQHYRHSFDPAWQARKGETPPMLSFWLEGEAFPPNTPRAEIERQLQDFATELGIKHDVPDLKAMYCVPPAHHIERLVKPTQGAVVLYAHPDFSSKLEAVRQTIVKERTHVKSQPRPGDHFLNDAYSWEQRLGVERHHTRQRDQVAIQDILSEEHPLLRMQSVQIDREGRLMLHLPRTEHQILNHATDGPMDCYFYDDDQERAPVAYRGTRAIALMMTPNFFDTNHYTPETGISDPEERHARQRDHVDEHIQPRIDAMAEALTRKLHIPVQAMFMPLDPQVFPDCEANAPGMVVLMVPPKLQHAALTELRRELNRQRNIGERER